MNRLGVHARGLKQLRTDLKAELQRHARAFAAALYAEGLRADARALEEDMAPWDTGRLKQSHYVGPPTEQGSQIIVELGYGVAYAIYVHERTELRHPHGQAKWLARTLAEVAQGFEARLASKVRRALELGISFRAIPATAPLRPARTVTLKALPPAKGGSSGGP